MSGIPETHFVFAFTDLSLPEDINNKIMEFSMKNEKVIMVSEVKEVLFKDMENNLYSTFVPTTMGFSIGKFIDTFEKHAAQYAIQGVDGVAVVFLHSGN